MSGMETAPRQFEFVCEFEDEYAAIPPHMQEAIRRYVVQGFTPGQFLQSVITNDLRGAVGYADAVNLPLLKLYVQWFYNVAPAPCRGSLSTMQQWMAARRSERA